MYQLWLQKTLTFVSNRANTYGSIDFRTTGTGKSDPFDTGAVWHNDQCLSKQKHKPSVEIAANPTMSRHYVT